MLQSIFSLYAPSSLEHSRHRRDQPIANTWDRVPSNFEEIGTKYILVPLTTVPVIFFVGLDAYLRGTYAFREPTGKASGFNAGGMDAERE